MRVSPRKPSAKSRAKGDSRDGTIQSAARGLHLVRALICASYPKSLAELTAELGLHKATLVRLLRTLMSEGIAVQDPITKRYAWSPADTVRFAGFAHPMVAVVTAVQGVLDDVAARSGGTAILAMPDCAGRNAAPAMYALPSTAIHLDPAACPLVPLHVISAGKCYLAHLAEPALTEYLNRKLEKPTPRAIGSRRALMRELAKVRDQGYATSRGEMDGVSYGLAVPVRAPWAGAGVVAGLAAGYPSSFPENCDLDSTVGLLRSAANAISTILSYQWWASHTGLSDPSAPARRLLPHSADPGFGNEAIPAVRSVARVMRIVGLLLAAPAGLSVGEVARLRGLTNVNAMRLLRTLEREGSIVRDAPRKRYRISPLAWLRVARVLRDTTSLATVTHRILQRLANSSGATASMVAPDATMRTLVDYHFALPDRIVRFNPDDDSFPPLHATSGGKCYLADQPGRVVEQYCSEPLLQWTPNTITLAERLKRELDAVRRHGYALNRAESYLGVGAVAVPLSDLTGRVVGAVTLAMPMEELTEASIRRWLPLLRSASAELSRVLVPDWRERIAQLK